MDQLGKYAQIVGDDHIQKIRDEAASLEGKSFAHVNSTYYGGGVAEMLNSYLPLLYGAGISVEWRLLKGSRDYFTITKKIHNALQGKKETLTPEEIELYESTVKMNSEYSNLKWLDCVIIDDPQPLPLINHYPRTSPAIWKPLPILLELETYQKKQPWVWRVHIDLSTPQKPVFNYLNRFISKYDAVIVSHKKYGNNIKKPQYVIPPAIDPLSEKNRPMKTYEIDRILDQNGIDRKLPIISQISRFDPWKDPLGVIKAYDRVKKKHKCQLVLLGSHASDDPESEEVFKQVFRIAEKEKNVTLISMHSDLLVNALQRESAVIVQKSLREGFGLTISEALWKGTPVVASNVGGIPLQIDDGKNGFLINSISECADKIEFLLKNPQRAAELGANGHEKVKGNFLITRLALDEIRVLKEMTAAEKIIKPPRAVGELIGMFKKAPRLVRRGLNFLTNH
ncbi:MAG: glycosyltransferase [Candidatus Micrarchaeota archaeon]